MPDRKEYIERGALLDALTSEEAAKVLQHSAVRAVCLKSVFDRIPAADVVEVVRCRECRKRGKDECPFHVKGEPADEELLKDLDDDFCSYGERKDGAE